MRFQLRRLLLAGLIVPFAFFITSAVRAGPIEDRQAKMKIVGRNMSIVAKMAKGDTEFNADAALQAYVDMKGAIEGFSDFFPEGSGEGKTEAGPAIFEDRAGFVAKQAAFEATLTSVTEYVPADLPALQASLKEVGGNCGACHKGYRVKKN